jgi:hypothetical protein
MPLTIDCPAAAAPIELGELIESLERDFDPLDQAALPEWGPALSRLANNRRFLADLVIDELKQHCSGQTVGNHYGA